MTDTHLAMRPWPTRTLCPVMSVTIGFVAALAPCLAAPAAGKGGAQDAIEFRVEDLAALAARFEKCSEDMGQGRSRLLPSGADQAIDPESRFATLALS